MQSYKRKQWIVYPSLQWGFLGYTLAVSLLISAIHFCAIQYFFYSFSQLAQQVGIPTDHIFFRFISEQRSKMSLILAISSLLVMLVLTFLGVLLSHRVAGPIYRMQKWIEGGCQGDLTFRKNDYLKEVAESINKSCGSIGKSE